MRGQTKLGVGAVVVVVGAALGVALSVDTGGAKLTSVDDARDAGLLANARVYRANKLDGGTTMVAIAASTDGGADVVVNLAHSPCAQRPAGVSTIACSYKVLGGDHGDGNVMQDGEWFGPGCVETPCTIMFGDTAP